MRSPDLDEPGDRARRAVMVETQIVRRGLRHPRVVEAMRLVPRHLFVPDIDRDAAYDDRPLPIGGGQTISQPYMVALMTVALDPQPGDRVLEVGTGSGYQAAVLAVLCGELITMERHPALAERARAALARLGLDHVRVVVGDGSVGFPEGAPYGGIVVTAAAPSVPAPLQEQLAVGGRLVIPVGSTGYQELIVETRTAAGFTRQTREGCVFVPLIGQAGFTD